MASDPAIYLGYSFLTEIISHAVWLYHVSKLSQHYVEMILAAASWLHAQILLQRSHWVAATADGGIGLVQGASRSL